MLMMDAPRLRGNRGLPSAERPDGRPDRRSGLAPRSVSILGGPFVTAMSSSNRSGKEKTMSSSVVKSVPVESPATQTSRRDAARPDPIAEGKAAGNRV